MKSRFAELCTALCEIAGLSPVEPEADVDGALVSHINLDDVEIQFLCESESAERVFSRVNFGPIEAEDATRQWGDVLEANFGLFSIGGAAFSRDPWIGALVLQQRWSVSIAAHELLDGLSRQCAAARAWRSEGLKTFALAQGGLALDPAVKA